MTTYSLFSLASGPPAAATAYSGPYEAGVCFQVTQWGKWFYGFSWWVADTGQQITPQTFVLWQLVNNITGAVVPMAAATSGVLTAGQFNFVPLAVPVQLSAGIPYVAATGYVSTTGFPFTPNQFGAGQPFAAGIVNGPLMAFSDLGASNPAPNNWLPQGVFSSAFSDPTADMPFTGSSSANFWMDVVISDVAPAGAAFRLWPSMPVPPNMIADTAAAFTLATEIGISVPCMAAMIGFYSPPGAPNLPTEAGVFTQSSQGLVAGSHLNPPAWSGAAGSGWVYAPYSGLVLPAASYRPAVANSAGTAGVWNNATINYFLSGEGAGGITSGPMTAPGESTADAPGQGSFNLGAALTWPGTFDIGAGPSYWVDIIFVPLNLAAGFLPVGRRGFVTAGVYMGGDIDV